MRKTINGGVTVTYEVWDGEGNHLISTANEDEAYRIRRKAHNAGSPIGRPRPASTAKPSPTG